VKEGREGTRTGTAAVLRKEAELGPRPSLRSTSYVHRIFSGQNYNVACHAPTILSTHLHTAPLPLPTHYLLLKSCHETQCLRSLQGWGDFNMQNWKEHPEIPHLASPHPRLARRFESHLYTHKQNRRTSASSQTHKQPFCYAKKRSRTTFDSARQLCSQQHATAATRVRCELGQR